MLEGDGVNGPMRVVYFDLGEAPVVANKLSGPLGGVANRWPERAG